jgi:hypothetical protein
MNSPPSSQQKKAASNLDMLANLASQNQQFKHIAAQYNNFKVVESAGPNFFHQ